MHELGVLDEFLRLPHEKVREIKAGFDDVSLPVADFSRLPWPAETTDVVVTEKDAVKIQPGRAGRTQVWVAPLDFEFDAAVGQALVQWLPSSK